MPISTSYDRNRWAMLTRVVDKAYGFSNDVSAREVAPICLSGDTISGVDPTNSIKVPLFGLDILGRPVTAPGTVTPQTAITASGAVNPRAPASYVITAGSAVALTLAAPIAGQDDGLTINIRSATAFAHTVSTAGLLNTGSAAVALATFAAFAGASLMLTAWQGKWMAEAVAGVTFS